MEFLLQNYWTVYDRKLSLLKDSIVDVQLGSKYASGKFLKSNR